MPKKTTAELWREQRTADHERVARDYVELVKAWRMSLRADETNIEHVMNQMTLLPEAVQVFLVKGMIKDKPDLIHTLPVGRWAFDNAGLMATIDKLQIHKV